MTDLFSFWYELEKQPTVISLLLTNGTVVSGKFSNSRRPSITIGNEGVKVAIGDFLLKSVTVASPGGVFVKLPELIVLKDNVTAWGHGKLTPVQLLPDAP